MKNLSYIYGVIEPLTRPKTNHNTPFFHSRYTGTILSRYPRSFTFFLVRGSFNDTVFYCVLLFQIVQDEVIQSFNQKHKSNILAYQIKSASNEQPLNLRPSGDGDTDTDWQRNTIKYSGMLRKMKGCDRVNGLTRLTPINPLPEGI